uniref:Uncharacterized protein n=1 Tax=Myoviridae sp. ctj3P51 TaxID=2826687 RepID=A0A8S5NR23_9CAUD|nr:MAG TPA: hypothetical protein [Myoviridae sp. ctj3P51]
MNYFRKVCVVCRLTKTSKYDIIYNVSSACRAASTPPNMSLVKR